VPLAEEKPLPFPKVLERGISTPSATDTRYIVFDSNEVSNTCLSYYKKNCGKHS